MVIYYPECGSSIPKYSKFCHYCRRINDDAIGVSFYKSKGSIKWKILAGAIFTVFILIIIALAYSSSQQPSTYIYQPPRYHMDWRLHDSFTVRATDKYCTTLNLHGTVRWKIEWEKFGVGEDRFIATIYLNLDQRYVFDSFNEDRTSGYKEYYPDISPYDDLCLKVHDGTWLIKIYIWDLVPY